MPFCKTTNLPIVLNTKNRSVFDIITFFIKFILLFDTSCLFPNLKKKVYRGGSLGINSEDTPEQQDNFYASPDAQLYSQMELDQRSNSGSMTPELTEEEKLLEKSNYDIISKEIGDSLKAGKNYIVAFLLVIVNFFFNASLYPAMPFFGVLAFCYAILNWFFMKFKKF